MFSQLLRQRLSIGSAMTVALLLSGCGGGGEVGPDRYKLSGAVTLDGQPAAAGTIQFEPDSSKGNTGPATTAIIKDGKYSTPEGKGSIGGPHTVKIDLYDGQPKDESQEYGSPVLKRPHEETVELPKQDGTQDFAITAGK